MKDFSKEISDIKSKAGFIGFVDLLILNLKENPEEWENKNLSDYLTAIASWVENMEGYYEHMNIQYPKDISWRTFADILMAAKMYE